MGKALSSLSEEDPTFTVRTDEDTGQTIIAGMGELHLEVLVDRMLREFSVEANVGKPQVAYRETITGVVEKHRYTHKKQTGGSGQFADIVINARAHRPRRRLRVHRQDHRRAHPQGVHPGGRPRRPGRPHLGRARRLPDGRRARHARSTAATTTSTPRRWRSAPPASWASRKRPARPSRCILEPIMAVEVVTPEDYMGDVMGDLSSRRGHLTGTEQRGSATAIRAHVPAVGDVRLRGRPAQPDPGPGHLHHAVRQLPAGAVEHPGRDRQAGSRRVAAIVQHHRE